MKNAPLRFSVCFLAFLSHALFLPPLEAQEPQPSAPPSRGEAPYLLPQTIFVGDPGRLVVPLGQAFSAADPFVSEGPGITASGLVIRRLELERRDGVSRLFIDFIPYAPGLLLFPPLELPVPGAEPLTVTGLEAQVASILTPSQTALSEPSPPAAVPGTGLLVYGTSALVLALLALGIGGSIWGRRHFGEFWERFRKRYLIRAMLRFLRRLEQEGETGKKGNPGYYLTLLSGQFREFLSLFTGTDCRPLTALEFMELPLGRPGTGGDPENNTPASQSPLFLCRLFSGWDTLRFSGKAIDKIDLFLALKETRGFVSALDDAGRGKAPPEPDREPPAGDSVPKESRLPGEPAPAGEGTGGF